MNENNEINNANEKELELFEQFARVEWLFHRYHQHNHRMHGPMGDPHRGQGRVLSLLKMQPEISQKDLSFLLDMRPQSIGELLGKLERGGFITRTPSETDRRVVNIKLTEEGVKATEQQPDYDNMFDCLSEEEREVLSSYLNRIIAYMEEQFGGEDFDPRSAWFGDPRMREGFDPRSGMDGEDLHGMMDRLRGMARGRGGEHEDDGRFGGLEGFPGNRGGFGSRRPMHDNHRERPNRPEKPEQPQQPQQPNDEQNEN